MILYQYTDADIYGDSKIYRVNDWAPILNTIKINKSLEFIAVRSYYTPPSEENGQFSSRVSFIIVFHLLWNHQFSWWLIFMEIVGTSHPCINILHEFINYAFEAIFPFAGIREYIKLCPHVPMNCKQSMKISQNIFY